jgi:hypothetical protein
MTIQAEIDISNNGRYLNATATAPQGFSWDNGGGCHQLVISWCESSTAKNRLAIRAELDSMMQQRGPMMPCPEDCECRDL